MSKFKTLSIFAIAVLAFAGCTNIFSSATDDTDQQVAADEYTIDESDFLNGEKLIVDENTPVLNDKEKAGLIQMREEEKLARDVYQLLGDTWNIQIFNNIAKSEQTHTDSVKTLLDKYGIEDPVRNDENGAFASEAMAGLFQELSTKGTQSPAAALQVGATIEDLDIYDLDVLLAQTENQDIISVYKNLQKGSRNHLRAFIKQIEREGETYTPQYISKEAFNEIISGEQEKGRAR